MTVYAWRKKAETTAVASPQPPQKRGSLPRTVRRRCFRRSTPQTVGLSEWNGVKWGIFS